MDIFGIKLSKLQYKSFLDNIKNSNSKTVIFTPNPEILLAAKANNEFREVLEKGDYLVPDGIGIYAAFQILDNKLPKLLNLLLIPFYGINLFIKRKKLYEMYGGRIVGSILTKDLVEYANEKGLGVTIIDKYEAPGEVGDDFKIKTQKLLIEKLNKKYPNAVFHLYLYTKESEEKIINEINSTDDVYLFSSQGLKTQEITITEMMPKLKNIRVAAGIGGSFDLIAGFKKRAPKLIVRLGLEWLWRLILHPKRMAKRIWKALFVFLWEVTWSKS